MGQVPKYFIEYYRNTPSGYGVKCLGIQVTDGKPPERKIGITGRVNLTLIEPLTLTKGHKTVVYAASRSKPLEVWTAIIPFQVSRA